MARQKSALDEGAVDGQTSVVSWAITALAALCLATGVAVADPGPEAETASPGLTLSYFWDGGAVPFVWGALGARLAIDHDAAPAAAAPVLSRYAGPALGIGLGSVILASGDQSRWYHVKGLTETMMTGALLSSGLGSWSSTQSTQAFQIATYGILYLRGHVFDSRRGSSFPWLEAATYAGIGVAATAVAGEGVYHKRESLAEVVFGGLLGTTSSTLFYLYQEKRYRNGKRAVGLDSLRLKPSVTSTSATLGMTLVW